MFKQLFVGFMFFIVILQTFLLIVYQNPFNGFFSMMNQIESYLAFSMLDKRQLLKVIFAKEAFF